MWRSRHKAWIPDGKKLVKRVTDGYLKCILGQKKLFTQWMADLPKEKFFQGKPWTNVCLDLAGPVEVREMNNARSKLKTWPLLITCLNTGALTINLMHQYSTSAFLIQWEHFVAVRGRPTWVHSDPGSQLPGSSLKERRISTLQLFLRKKRDTAQHGSFVPQKVNGRMD